MGSRIPQTCARIAESGAFQAAVVAAILANGVVIGLETYDSIEREHGDLLRTLNDVFLGLFTIELAIRIAAFGSRPQRFFQNGWNVFDFLVVGLAYLPWIRESVTLLRLARLLRIARLISIVPGLRVVLVGVGRSLAPIGSLALLTFFLLYMYGMLGWWLFSDHDPERFGTIGDALLTLFQVLTLEGWNEVLAKEMELSSWAWVYFVSFVLIATFVVLNVVIGIVVNSIDEAHAIEEEKRQRELIEAERKTEHAGLYDRLRQLRSAIDGLEEELARGDEVVMPPGSGPRPSPADRRP
jgi:voltage-gated sodium channel